MMPVQKLLSLSLGSAALMLAGSALACPYADKAEMAENGQGEFNPELMAEGEPLPLWMRQQQLEIEAEQGDTVNVPN